jgi:hypothetical protein
MRFNNSATVTADYADVKNGFLEFRLSSGQLVAAVSEWTYFEKENV